MSLSPLLNQNGPLGGIDPINHWARFVDNPSKSSQSQIFLGHIFVDRCLTYCCIQISAVMDKRTCVKRPYYRGYSDVYVL